jgi:6-pyruvoyltetrahydropterin/6-carboxytetrahydropterin synthase
MVLDFGFLKDAMINVIDRSIDHGFVASIDDHELLLHLLPQRENPVELGILIKKSLADKGYWLSTEDHLGKIKTLLATKLYVIPYIPTSERLAEHFFNRLREPVREQSQGIAELTNLRFWETPNCYSDYPGFTHNSI